METIKLKDDFIKLGQALKAANLVEDGVEAKYVIQDGLVSVNGEIDTRRGDFCDICFEKTIEYGIAKTACTACNHQDFVFENTHIILFVRILSFVLCLLFYFLEKSLAKTFLSHDIIVKNSFFIILNS